MGATNEYMREYNARRYRERRDKFVAHLGGVCVVCGTTDELQFDHIDPTTKHYTIGKILLGRDDKVYSELEKCQLLCKTHHEEKTGKEFTGRGPTKVAPHGTRTRAYVHKCRCEVCSDYKEAWNARRRRERSKHKGR